MKMRCWLMRWISYILCVWIGIIPALHAQQLITAFSVDQGLPQSTVTSIYRDNEGYLWCGTGSGLGLYDGWEFQKPKQSKEKPNPSLTSIVRGIVPSSDQKTIWVGSETTVNQFDRYNYHLLRTFDLVRQPGIGECPLVANDTSVWITCGGAGLFRVRIADGKSTQITHSGSEGRAGVSDDKRMIVFTDTSGKLITYDIITRELSAISLPCGLQSTEIYFIHSMPGSLQYVFLLTKNGIWLYDTRSRNITRFLLGDPLYEDSTFDFRAMDVHPDGSWWFGIMGQGVFRYDPLSRKMRPCLWQQDGTFTGKLMTAPTSIVCDDYGVVWCGTDGSGVVKLLHGRLAFRDKYLDPLITDTCNWFVRCFYEMSPGKYLVGTFRGGIHLVDHNTNKITRVSYGPLWTNVTPHFITEYGDGRLLVGTEQSVVLLDTANWSTEEISNAKITNDKYVGYLHLSSGDLLVYGNLGVYRIESFPSPGLTPVGRAVNVSGAIQMRDGRIIIATFYDGLQEITPDGTLLKKYDYEKHIGIPATSIIRGMFEDKNSQLWLGSESGLYNLDSEFKLETITTSETGISDNTIYAVTALNDQNMILATGHGITLFNTSTLVAQIFNGADGLPSDECNSGALMLAPSGLLYIGTTSGFVRWNPLHTSTCFRTPDILASYSENEDEASGIIRESLVRDYGSGAIELCLWLTDFAFAERVKYTHQLEGSGEASKTEAGLRKVTYAALGSGFYSFLCSAEVPGCDPIGISKLLTIKIVPPFWMSGWFIALSGMGVIVIFTLVLFIIMRLNYQRKIRKLKMQQELDRVRARISRDIHDEIGAGLTRIALSGELMAQKVNAGEITSEKLKTIAGTARELSQSMKEVVWSVNPHYDSLDHMAAYFRSYASGVAENADVRFVYVADDKLPAIPVNPETRRNLLLIVKEAFSNAVKYAEATELRLEIQWRDNKLTMVIADNGKGFDSHDSSRVNANGLRNIRQRAEASGCTVTIESSPGKGTSIRVQGPVS